MPQKPDRFRLAVVAIVVVAAAVRLLHVYLIRRAPFFTTLMGDARAYDEWAQRIAGGDWMGTGVFYQAPLYPYFLGAIYSIAGRSLLAVRVVQALIGSASCVLLALAGRRWFGERAGIIAGFMLALYAPAIFFDGLLQKSTLDLFFICLALWLIAKGDSFLVLGLTLGALALTRENALVLIAVVLAWSAWSAREEKLIRSALVLAGIAIVLLPVAARNSYVGGGFYLTTSQFGPNFYIGNHAGADGTYASLRYGRGSPEYERQDAVDIAERALGRHLSPAEVSEYWTDRAFEFITSDPGSWVRLMGRKILLLWNAGEMLDTESLETHAERSWPLRVGGVVGHFGVLVPLAVFGMIATWPIRNRVMILHALLWSYAASVVVFYVFARYRFPLVPFLVLFAAAGLIAAASGSLLRRPLAPVMLAVSATVVFTNWPILSGQMMRTITEHNLAAAFQSDGRFDDAIAHYARAIALSPDYAPAYSNLASTFRSKQRLPEAIATFERALRLKPDYSEAHYNLANALLEAGRPDEALDHFARAREIVPSSAEVHNNLGIAWAATGRLDEAIGAFRDALKFEPESVKAHRNLGDALVSRGDVREGLEHLREAARIAPSDGSLRYDLGSALLESGRVEDALPELDEAVRLLPTSAEAHNNLGIALGSAGQMDEAAAHFRAALELRPDFEDARRNLQMTRSARRRP